MLKNVLKLLFLLLLVLSLVVGCGGEDEPEDDDDDRDDGDTPDGDNPDDPFVRKSIAPMTGDGELAYYGEKIALKNDSVFYYASFVNGNSDSILYAYHFSGMTDDYEIQDRTETIARLSDFGLVNYEVKDFDTDACGRLYFLASQMGGDTNMVWVNVDGNDVYQIGAYNHAYLWVDGCMGGIRGQVLAYTYGWDSIYDDDPHITDSVMWDYDTERTERWVKRENLFDEITEGQDIFNNAKQVVFGKFRSNYYDASAIILIDANSQLRYLYSVWDQYDYETQRFRESEELFNGFNNRGYKASNFAIDNMENLFAFRQIQYPENDNAPIQMCVVGFLDENDETPYLWVTGGTNALPFSEDRTFEIGFPGPCGITTHTEATGPNASVRYPWVAYRSAKNALSMLFLSRTQGDWYSVPLDSIPQTAWHFASNLAIVGTSGSGQAGRIMTFYDDNDTIRFATCKERSTCGDY